MQSNSDGSDVNELLAKWEQVYKKGLLTFWILLLLHERPAYPYEMSAEIRTLSLGTLSADDNSLYRALSRFEGVGIVVGEFRQSDSGPPRKYYRLTSKGFRLLANFIRRNILIFESPEITRRIQAILRNFEVEESDR